MRALSGSFKMRDNLILEHHNVGWVIIVFIQFVLNDLVLLKHIFELKLLSLSQLFILVDQARSQVKFINAREPGCKRRLLLLWTLLFDEIGMKELMILGFSGCSYALLLFRGLLRACLTFESLMLSHSRILG